MSNRTKFYFSSKYRANIILLLRLQSPFCNAIITGFDRADDGDYVIFVESNSEGTIETLVDGMEKEGVNYTRVEKEGRIFYIEV